MACLAAIVLCDARFPGGGHAHSGGLEEAVARELVTGLGDLASFLSGRLRTVGLVNAAFAAAAVLTARPALPDPPAPASTSAIKGKPSLPEIDKQRAALDHRRQAGAGGQAGGGRGLVGGGGWGMLDAELDARTPSVAQRGASRAQGRATLRAARRAWPSPVLDALCAAAPRPHHALLVGAVIGIDGGSPADAAQCVAYLSVSGPASAAIRLLGLDPFEVNAAIVALHGELDAVVEQGVHSAGLPAELLPSPGAPVLDLMAQAHLRHHRKRVRLFAS
ncbi:MAG: urease accessory protein UreF [Pseudonocardia sp.]